MAQAIAEEVSHNTIKNLNVSEVTNLGEVGSSDLQRKDVPAQIYVGDERMRNIIDVHFKWRKPGDCYSAL